MRLETKDQYAGGKENMDKYCVYTAAVSEIEKCIIHKKHTLRDNLQFYSKLRIDIAFIVKL